jgi:hypothetical protein
VRFDVLSVAKMSILFFWVVTLSVFVDRYQCFFETLVSILEVHMVLQPRTLKAGVSLKVQSGLKWFGIGSNGKLLYMENS